MPRRTTRALGTTSVQALSDRASEAASQMREIEMASAKTSHVEFQDNTVSLLFSIQTVVQGGQAELTVRVRGRVHPLCPKHAMARHISHLVCGLIRP